jgi:MFS transporter, PHS family, inorganic phosphate transporter
MFLYCLANFFQNFGPNVTTFVIPGEVFPTRYRSTGHGFSAACGKLGAIVAQYIFFMKADAIQTMYVSVKLCHCINDLSSTFLSLQIFGFVMLSGVASTLLLPETRGRSLEELSNENQKGFIRGARKSTRAKVDFTDMLDLGANQIELRNGIVLRRTS